MQLEIQYLEIICTHACTVHRTFQGYLSMIVLNYISMIYQTTIAFYTTRRFQEFNFQGNSKKHKNSEICQQKFPTSTIYSRYLRIYTHMYVHTNCGYINTIPQSGNNSLLQSFHGQWNPRKFITRIIFNFCCQNQSGWTNFGSQNWSPLPILVPPVKFKSATIWLSLASQLSTRLLIEL